MKGLLIKDIRLLLSMKQHLLIFLAVCALIAFTTDGSFIIGYTAGLLGIMGLSTLGFDEHDNGFPFLFSLPVDVKTYVNEKYLFCILLDLFGAAVGTVLFVLACLTKGKTDAISDGIVYLALYLPMTLLLILSILPGQMVFGREKSRIITMLVYGVLFVLSAVIVKIVGPVDQLKAPQNLPEWLSNAFFIAAVACVLVLAFCAGMYLFCLKAMRNKEF